MPASDSFMVDGVQAFIHNGSYYFAKEDVFRRFGLPNAKSIGRGRPKKPLHEITMPDGRAALSFPELLTLAKKLPSIPEDFVNNLTCFVKRNSTIVRRRQPQFASAEEAAKALATEKEARKQAERKLAEYKELLGDGEESKIVHAIPWLDEFFAESRSVIAGLLGACLARISREKELPIRRCPAFGYSSSISVGMYHVDAIKGLRRQLKKRKYLFANHRLAA